MYKDKQKQSSPVKVAGNLLLKEKATPNGHYVVIDAPSLRSFTALTEKGVTPQNILVINKDQKVIDKVKEHGGRGVAGVSTTVLKHYRGYFDGIYLDYCGTPKGNPGIGYVPQTDICWFVANLKPNGFMAITFARRGCTDAISLAKSLIPSSMHLVYERTYFETCAMYMMVLSKIPDDTGLAYMCKTIYKDAPMKIPLPEESDESEEESEEPKKVFKPRQKPKRKYQDTPVELTQRLRKRKKVSEVIYDSTFKQGDIVGVKYRLESGKFETLSATVKRVLLAADKTFKYTLKFHKDGEGITTIREEHITKLKYGIKHLVSLWLKTLKNPITHHNYKTYAHQLTEFLKTLKVKDVSQIRVEHLQSFRNSLPCKPSSRTVIYSIRSLFNFLHENNYTTMEFDEVLKVQSEGVSDEVKKRNMEILCKLFDQTELQNGWYFTDEDMNKIMNTLHAEKHLLHQLCESINGKQRRKFYDSFDYTLPSPPFVNLVRTVLRGVGKTMRKTTATRYVGKTIRYVIQSI